MCDYCLKIFSRRIKNLSNLVNFVKLKEKYYGNLG